MNTLLIVDMQNAWINENPRFDIENIFTRINLVAQAFRAQGRPVIFIRHNNEEAPIGSSAWQTHPSLQNDVSDIFVNKLACDPFAQTDLMDQLQMLSTTSVTICGLATEFCVDSAIRASLSAGFDVQVLSDAHTTADRDHLPAKAIIEHHNWIWTHLAAPAGRHIAVKPSALLLAAR